jgi:hydroxypyruvate isomerase
MARTTDRRQALKHLTLGAAGALAIPGFTSSCQGENASSNVNLAAGKTPFRHSVCRWCFQDTPLEAFAEQVKPMGITSIELCHPDEWPVLKNHGLTCAVGTVKDLSLTDGYNQPELHAALNKKYMDLAEKAADFGIEKIIVFSGNRKGLDDVTGMENCAVGLDPLVKHAEKLGIMVVMELLNSKVDHIGYQCDKTPWGAALVEKIGSPNFKLLYDIYHMQIMEGDVIRTITDYKEHIAHFHTAGVPGRHEIDETQELYYPAIMRAIAENGFTGFVAQEFIPTAAKPFESLRKSIEICSV